MKNRASLISCLLIALTLLAYRGHFSDITGERKLMITQWDAFGYYLYLPATTIYHDYKKLDWAPAIDKEYNVTGGGAMPVVQLDNGDKVSKYFCGVAIMQAPLFAVAHLIARVCGCPADGFSPIYQHALAFGVIIYCLLALLLLRHILLRYFKDGTVAVTLLLLCLASNFIQYAAVDNGLSHVWIFPLYVLLLYATIKWHERPKALFALAIGYIVGLATICRPTEAIALFIPLLWNLYTKEASRAKWAAVRNHRLHILYVAIGGFLGILPQLLYWKAVTGSYVFDVGSKWVFLNPWWRVLIGWEKGWFIYTPVALLFVAGLFFIRPFPFRKAVITFCLLNIWIIISWDEWQYGASYSTRALVQSYPVFALPLAALVERIHQYKWRPVLWLIGAYLVGVNLFQIVQYNTSVLHYNDMNRHYYSRIYLNPQPSPLDMSLLDTQEWLDDEESYQSTTINLLPSPKPLLFAANETSILADTSLASLQLTGDSWLRLEASIDAPKSLWQSQLSAELKTVDSSKQTSVRLYNPVGTRTGNYAFYMHVPAYFSNARLKVLVSSDYSFEGTASSLRLTVFRR